MNDKERCRLYLDMAELHLKALATRIAMFERITKIMAKKAMEDGDEKERTDSRSMD